MERDMEATVEAIKPRRAYGTAGGTPDWLLPGKVREELGGISDDALKRLIQAGRLTVLRLPGARVRISAASVKRLIEECTDGSPK
jgi:excisionase family DNA binding protein